MTNSITCFEEWHEHSEQRQWELYQWRISEIQSLETRLAAAEAARDQYADDLHVCARELAAADTANGQQKRLIETTRDGYEKACAKNELLAQRLAAAEAALKPFAAVARTIPATYSGSLTFHYDHLVRDYREAARAAGGGDAANE